MIYILLGLLPFILLFVLFSKIGGLNIRVSKLEKEIKNISLPASSQDKVPVNPITGVPIWDAQGQPVLSNIPRPQEVKAPISQNDPVLSFMNWLKEDWLLKLGAFMIFIGFSWFIYYAISNGWIGEIGRIALGVVVGSVVMIFGWWRMQKYIKQGAVFLWLGSAVVIMTIFAARNMYDFFTPTSALFLMLVTTAFVVLASLKYQVKSLAVVSLIMSGLIPLFTGVTGEVFALFSYIAVILIGTVWVVSLTNWRILNLIAFVVYFLYSFPYILPFSHQTESNVVLMFIYGFSLLLFVVSILSVLRKDIDQESTKYDIATSIFSSLFLLLSIISIADKDYSSLIIALWMIIYSVGSYLVFSLTGKRENFFIYSSISIAYLGAATAVELSGPGLIIAFIIEATLIPVAIYLISKEAILVKRFSFLMAVPAFLSLDYFQSYKWRDGFYPDGFTVIFFVSIGLFILAFLNNICSQKSKEKNPLVALFAIIGSLFVFSLVWLVSHAGSVSSYRAISSSYSSATLFSLVFYTIVGLFSFVYGKFKESKVARIYGTTVVTLVVLRFLFVDYMSLTIGTRVIAAFAIGIILISSAFINKKKIN